MRLSILDQSPIVEEASPKDALEASIELAKLGDRLGYSRYWIAEHHDLSGFASSSPEVMLGIIGSQTNRIKIGSGATLLPHYKPYKVAEWFNLLETLYPNRLDIGIGRAPGGSAEASIALSGNFLENVKQMPNSITELLHFINNDFPDDHFYATTKASPLPVTPPTPWILGTSIKSAQMAAEKGLGYVFGYFMSDKEPTEIINAYRSNYKQKQASQSPYVILTVSVICAKTHELAEEIALSADLYAVRKAKGELTPYFPSVKKGKVYSFTKNEKDVIKEHRNKLIIGSPKDISDQLKSLQSLYQADEIMIVTITGDYQDRLNSYQLIASELLTNS